MTLRNLETGRLFKVVEGFILDEANYKKLDVTASFLTLNSLDNGEEVMYAWKYWAPNEYELITGEQDGNGHDEDSIGSGALVEDSAASDGIDTGADGVSQADSAASGTGSN